MFSFDLRSTIVLLIGFAIAIAVHEFSHAAAARALGDRTAQRAGRLTLNPIAHLDPFGTLMIILTSLSGIAGFGWGKPVPFDPRAVRFGRFGGALVSVAGPLSNFLLAVATLALLAHADVPEPIAPRDLGNFALMNVGLCAFNLLPVPPLDGFGVLFGVVPRAFASLLARVGQYGPGILLLLVFSANILPIRPPLLDRVLDPVIRTLAQAAVRLAGAT